MSSNPELLEGKLRTFFIDKDMFCVVSYETADMDEEVPVYYEVSGTPRSCLMFAADPGMHREVLGAAMDEWYRMGEVPYELTRTTPTIQRSEISG